ncbi:MAG: HD domain-containing protein [bacterium]
MTPTKITKRLTEFSQAINRQKDFNFIKKLFKQFPKSEVFLVGGVVRDTIMDKDEAKDFDFVIRGVGLGDLQEFLCQEGIVDLVGKNFGVIKFKPFDSRYKISFDIALPRTEHSFLSGGYRDFAVQANPDLAIEDDLSRRDFTINALAWDFKKEKLIDPFGGLADIKNKTIRAVGEPNQRFKEDYSRMLRAIRLACQLDFQIEKATWQVIKKNIKRINDEKNGDLIVPRETVGAEFLKSFYHDPVRALDLYEESGFLKVLAPELIAMQGCPQPANWHTEGDVWFHTRLALTKLSSKVFQEHFGEKKPASTNPLVGRGGPSANLTIALLLHDIGKPATIQTPAKDGSDRIRFNEHDTIGAQMAEVVCRRLKLSSSPDLVLDIDQVVWLIKSHMLLMQGSVDKMKNATIEKYFFSQHHPSQDLLQLNFADALATVPQKGDSLGNFRALEYRIDQIKKLGRDHASPPPKLVAGEEIMKISGLTPGPLVGKILTAVREEQLRGKITTSQEAKKFVKKLRLADL